MEPRASRVVLEKTWDSWMAYRRRYNDSATLADWMAKRFGVRIRQGAAQFLDTPAFALPRSRPRSSDGDPMTAGPWKIRLVAPDGSRCVRICQLGRAGAQGARGQGEGRPPRRRRLKLRARPQRKPRLERESQTAKALQWLDAIDHDLIIMVPVFAEKRIADRSNQDRSRFCRPSMPLMAELKNA